MNKPTTTNKEILISFDDTGSMHTIRTRVRRNVAEFLGRVFKTDPSVRIGIAAHGDYCDEFEISRTSRGWYLFKSHPLSNDVKSLSEFVRNTGETGGEGPFAAYEYVLHQARQFNWTDGHSKTLVMIGDEPPHDKFFRKGRELVWQNEAAFLQKMGVTIVTVQALNKGYATHFYRELAEMTGGYHLSLDQFDSIVEILEAIAYKQISPEALQSFEDTLFAGNRMNRNLDAVFGKLHNRPANESRFVKQYGERADLDAVEPSRFQSMRVDHDVTIQSFVNENSLRYEKGKGFYELVKSETIQKYKEIVLEDKQTGDMFTGRRARDLIGLDQDDDVTFTSTRKPWSDKYRVFVQSTSYTRKLPNGTKFLYEINKNKAPGSP